MRTLIGTLLACLTLCADAHAQTPWFELPAPAGALDVLGVDLTPGTALALERTMRVLHSAPRPGEPPPAILSFEQLLRDLDSVEGEAQRLGSRSLSLAMARNASERDVLKDVLKVLGFELRERRGVYTVEADRDQDAVELRKRL